MNIAIFSHVPIWTAHHAESVEIALDEANQGNKVFYISCDENVSGCPANPLKKKYLCNICQRQTRHSEKKILIHTNIFPEKLDLSNYSNSLSYKFESYSDLQSFRYKGISLGNLVYSTLVTELNDSFFSTYKYRNRIEELLNNSISIYENSMIFFNKKDIHKAYAWNGRRSSDGAFLMAAKSKGINYSPFISGGGYNKILVRDNSDTVHDIPKAINEIKEIKRRLEDKKYASKLKKRAEDFFNVASGQSINRAEKKEINYLGYYQFSSKYKRNKKFYSNFKGKKIISAFTGTYSEFAGVEGYDTSNDFCKDFYEGISYLHKQDKISSNEVLVVRWHPNSRHIKGNERKKMMDLINNSPKNVFHVPPDSDFDSYELIENSEKIICFGSSISVEASLRQKSVIFIGRNMFQDLSCFERAEKYEDIDNFLKNNEKKLDYLDALSWGAYFSSFGNKEFRFVKQVSPKVFTYKNTQLKSLEMRILSFIRYTLRFFNF